MATAAAAAGLVVAGVTAATAAAAAVVTVLMARRVVTPVAVRDEDVRVVSVDLAAGEIRLESSPESAMTGRYGFWFDRESGHARLGDVLADDGRTVRRAVPSVDFGRLDRARRGRMNGWYYLGPWELGHRYENVLVETALGPAPAWHIPAETPGPNWIVQVHGRGAKRHEALRAVDTAREAGWDSLLVSYRNDGEAPDSVDRRYGLGGTEWADVVAAVRYAVEHGAERVVLMGWSMGGAISLQAVLRSDEVRERLVGIVLDSPAIDWSDILRFQGTLQRLPHPIGDLTTRLLGTDAAVMLTGLAAPIDLEGLDVIAHADELDVPMLLMHSVDDGFVPIDGSRRLAAARPDLVDFEVFEGARHTKLWNHDPERWMALLRRFLDRQADAAPAEDLIDDEIVG
ncbi:alpha/beta hydrolase family protein [Agromyces intestinalis]|uniref:alpha/beta hydrolase family protein n=1 Tax=Agromyces intestinalis TaxID=2592652 RepID=UPI00143D9E07|nr:alpha/beta fold hydrolase [Agromyces intestinalis]